MWWYMPVIPATQETEVGGSLEPRGLRLQLVKVTPLHLAWVIDPVCKKN